MNKQKLLYDVVKTMQAQENLQGTLLVEAKKDQTGIFVLESQFAKNLVTGQGQSKIKIEFDDDGKKIRHESSTEFKANTTCGFHDRLHQHFREHWHCRAGRLPHEGNPGQRCCGFKEGLNHIALLLQLLSSFKLEENAGQSYLLAVNSVDFPEELKKALIQKLQQHHDSLRPDCDESRFGACKLIRQLQQLEDHDLELKIEISPNYTVSQLNLVCIGSGKDENNISSNWELKVELNLR
jgi:hypothetical protein